MRRAHAVLLALLLALPLAALAAAPGEPASAALPEGRVPDTLVVGFVDALPADLDAWAAALGARVELRDDVLAWASLRFASGPTADAALPRILAREGVRYAEHDVWMGLLLEPNDPLYGQQWGPRAIELPAAWDLTLGSHAVRLAILDTGLSVAHPDLAANMCGPFASFIPAEPTIDDQNGHGTHVAGIAAAVTNNGVGIAGAGQSCIMGAKVLGRSGSSQGTSVAAGIRWAADNGAHVISMSLGRADLLQATADAVAYAYTTKGVLVIAAAGNSGCDGDFAVPLAVPPNPAQPQSRGSILYPAFHDEVVAVAALTNPGETTASFSSCGADMEVSAPGASILATYLGNGYATLSGTSMAAPYASGVAALLFAQHPGITALEARCILDLSSDDLALSDEPLPGRDYRTGWGRIDARAMLDLDRALTERGAHEAFAEACRAAAPVLMH